MDTRRGKSLKDLKREGRRKKSQKGVQSTVEDIYFKCCSVSMSLNSLRTGIVYDKRFSNHKCIWDPEYPEGPQRYQSVMDRLEDYQLVERCERIPTRKATRAEICAKHDAAQIDLLESTKHMVDSSELESLASIYDAIYFNKDTYETAHLAAGSVIDLVDAVCSGRVQNGMAVVRPPGHHATNDQYCGYCYFNNVALAAQNVLDKHSYSKIMIIDWDVHHGQATQRMFYEDPRVLYVSIHRYEHGSFWPNLRESNFNYIGAGHGLGYNVNIPLNETGCGDADYLSIFHTVIIPLAYEYAPELVLISAGYDAAVGCPEGEMRLSPAVYHHLTTSLMGLATGKVVAVLEGGYFIPSLAESAAQTLRALLGDPAPLLEFVGQPKPSVLATMYNVISLLRGHWKCFSHFHDRHIGEPDARHRHKVFTQYVGVESVAPFETRSCYPQHTAESYENFVAEITRLRNKFYDSPLTKRVGFVYDPIMELHKSTTDNAYERPERLTRAVEILKELNILDKMTKVDGRRATTEELCLCHDTDYVQKITTLGDRTETQLSSEEGWTTVYTCVNTLESSTLAAGSLVALTQAVLNREVTSGVAVIRPPGHHAEEDSASGFCIFNNVAVAAKSALAKGVHRIVILDIDIHHGNGIQNAFYQDPRVVYISLHRYDNGRYFPHKVDANYTQTGAGYGEGFNVNIAWNNCVMGDSEYMSAFTRIVLPIAYQFNPELVFIAAGFDACKGDPIGGYSVSPETFGHFVQLMKPLASGRIILALEGGYNVNSVGYALSMCAKSLLSEPLPALSKCGAVRPAAQLAIANTIEMHKKKWTLLIEDIALVTDTNTNTDTDTDTPASVETSTSTSTSTSGNSSSHAAHE